MGFEHTPKRKYTACCFISVRKMHPGFLSLMRWGVAMVTVCAASHWRRTLTLLCWFKRSWMPTRPTTPAWVRSVLSVIILFDMHVALTWFWNCTSYDSNHGIWLYSVAGGSSVSSKQHGCVHDRRMPRGSHVASFNFTSLRTIFCIPLTPTVAIWVQLLKASCARPG